MSSFSLKVGRSRFTGVEQAVQVILRHQSVQVLYKEGPRGNLGLGHDLGLARSLGDSAIGTSLTTTASR